MKLVITEKPSVAQSIAKVLGAKTRKDGYLEDNGYIVSWCLGHLFELAKAESYDEKYAKWTKEDLPIVPAKWKFVISKDKEERFSVLRSLMQREDVTEVINACDAGREGELIFRNVYYMAGCSKPMKRLWISSMEDEAIRKGFENLRPGSDYDGLYLAALCRAKADWLVGINATRLFSSAYHRTLNVGRVLSPTLAMLVERESQISGFTSKSFYTVSAVCNGLTAVSEKFDDITEATELAELCRSNPIAVKSIEKKEKSEKAPMLYDLTALQRDANRLLGYTAQQALDYLQSLYEKKLCTYPRTDSRYLTEDMQRSVPETAVSAAKICGLTLPDVIHSEQVCNSSKVTDHHAVIPTSSVKTADISELPKGEREILMLVAKRFVEAVSDCYRYAETVITFDCCGKTLTAKGKTVISLGWKSESTSDTPLPELCEGEVIEPNEVTVKKGKTTPPKHYTEDTLLSAMETAGKEDISEDAERIRQGPCRHGLGTPATRASILEKLISTGFVKREKNALIPVKNGTSIVTILPEKLKSAFLTAEWEQKLKMVERKEMSPEEFISGITAMMNEIIANYKPVKGSEVLFPSGRDVMGKCPRCGSDVTESKLGFFCEGVECKFGIWRDSKYFSSKHIKLNKAIVSKLLTGEKVHFDKLYSERTGTTYAADIQLEDDGSLVKFKMEFTDDKEGK